MRYTLMNKEIPVLSFETQITATGRLTVANEKIVNHDLLPISYPGNIKNYLNRRKAPKHREHIQKLLMKLGAQNIDGYIQVCNGASLTDTFWVRNEDQPKSWNEVSFYRNEFDENIAKLALDGGDAGMVGANAAPALATSLFTTTPEVSVNGQYAKCWIRENDELFLIKRGSQNYRRREVAAEFYSSQIFEQLCSNTVHYDAVCYHDKPASKCHIFTSEKYGYAPIINFFNPASSTEPEDFLALFEQFNDGMDYRRMVVADALTLNIDRHLGNFGFLIDNDTLTPVAAAPAFDFNRSMLFHQPVRHFMEQDLDEILAFPFTDGEFVQNAKEMLTDEIRTDLKNMHGFVFTKSGIEDWPDDRLQKYEGFIDKQIDNILGRSRVIINDIPPIRRTPSVSKSNKAKTPEIER